MQVNHPSHYNKQFIEAIDVIELFVDSYSFCLGNFIKYISRAPYKNNFKEDIRKAFWYLDRINFSKFKLMTNLSKFEEVMISKYIKNLCSGNEQERKCGIALNATVKYLSFVAIKPIANTSNEVDSIEFEKFLSKIQQTFINELLDELPEEDK